MEGSQRFKLNKEDLAKILKGFAIAIGGAGVAYILGILDYIDVDAYSPLYVALASGVLNILQRWITNQTK